VKHRLDALRSKAFTVIDRAPGKLGDLARKANDLFGRPLADARELEDRRAFAAHKGATVVTSSQTVVPAPHAEVAPVIVFHMDKSRREAQRLTEMLDAEKVPYKVSDIQEDPAAQAAVRRDSKGFGLPVVFIAGEPIGGRMELASLIKRGELKKKVFGGS
jgi:glutaredoxin